MTNIKTKKIDFVVIFLTAGFLIILNQMELMGKVTKFMFIPLLVFYYLGQFVERKYRSSQEIKKTTN